MRLTDQQASQLQDLKTVIESGIKSAERRGCYLEAIYLGRLKYGCSPYNARELRQVQDTAYFNALEAECVVKENLYYWFYNQLLKVEETGRA